jgi:hypothetical protein
MEETLRKLVDGLKDTYGDNLISVILYGSAASGEYRERSSDFNVLCVLKEISAPLLKLAGPAIQWFVRAGNAPPMFFTEEEIRNSHDVFPIEFLDMQVNHSVLAGRDIFAGLAVAKENHRLELEHELRTKYLGLRQRYTEACQHPRAVGELIFESLPAFITLFRHTLLLMGENVPVRKRDIIRLFCSRSGRDESLFLSLLDSKESGKALTAGESERLFPIYLQEITKVVSLVDELPRTGKGFV